MKQYIGISRDHSGSMSTIATNAAKDYNVNISTIQNAAKTNNIDTIVNVVSCGIGPGRGRVRREIINSNVSVLKPITHYETSGTSTPLYDSVGDLIDQLKAVPDYNDPDVSFLVMVITDGQENDSQTWNAKSISSEINRLQATDKWTFAFRVPKGSKRDLVHQGIPEGNILEWETTSAGLEAATAATAAAISNYYVKRSAGIKSSSTFYSDLSKVSSAQIQSTMSDITSQVSFGNVDDKRDGIDIKTFCEMWKGTFTPGIAYYQLVKREKEVQDYKKICIVDRRTGLVYTGASARDLLGIPHYSTISLSPGDHGNYDIYIQSTSINRKLPGGSKVLFYSGN